VSRPYAFSYFFGGIPFYSPRLVLETNFESGNPPSENQYFSTFQIPLKPRWANSIWNVEKYWPSRGNSHPQKWKQNETSGTLGAFPKIFSLCIGPMLYHHLDLLFVPTNCITYVCYKKCKYDLTWNRYSGWNLFL